MEYHDIIYKYGQENLAPWLSRNVANMDTQIAPKCFRLIAG